MKNQDTIYCRHPLYIVADELKDTFFKLGFQFLDNGEGREAEASGVSFATWAEPVELFGWQNDPIAIADSDIVMRTRLLPAHLKNNEFRFPLRTAAFGRVYKKNDPVMPIHHHFEGILIEPQYNINFLKDFWNEQSAAMFMLNTSASLEEIGNNCYKIIVRTEAKTIVLGYTGPASAEAMKACGAEAEELSGWVFVIDIDDVAAQYYAMAREELYCNLYSHLKQFKSANPSMGITPEYRVSTALRSLGYLETISNPFYPAGIYKKMNMIQEKWDTNNVGYQLKEPLGTLVSLRTVLTPGCEDTLAKNFKAGEKEVRLFELGHIFSVDKENSLPIERFTVNITAYGPDMNLETFLGILGIKKDYKLIPCDMAIAYKTDECLLLYTIDGKSLDGNFGQISPVALKNWEIDGSAFQANIEVKAPTDYAKILKMEA